MPGGKASLHLEVLGDGPASLIRLDELLCFHGHLLHQVYGGRGNTDNFGFPTNHHCMEKKMNKIKGEQKSSIEIETSQVGTV